MSATKTRTAPVLRIVSLAQPREPPVREHAQGDRRREPDADGERLLERRMPRVERRHEEYAQQRRDAKVVPERRGQFHLLIVNEIRHDESSCGLKRVYARLQCAMGRRLEGLAAAAINRFLQRPETDAKGRLRRP